MGIAGVSGIVTGAGLVGAAGFAGSAAIAAAGIECLLDRDGCSAVLEGIIATHFGGPACGNMYSEEHTKGVRPSTEEKHEKGEARKTKDRGGEKGDFRRRPSRKPPPNHTGAWPPKISTSD